MTSTNDGKDVKSNQTSGQKGKKYYLELYRSLEERLIGSESQSERVQNLCEAWRRIHSICRHAAVDSHPILVKWLEEHTAHVALQSLSEAERTALDETLVSVVQEVDSYASERDGKLPWEGDLQQRAEWYRGVLGNPWGHPVLKVLLDSEATPPDEETIIEWLKGERKVLFEYRVHELVASKKTRDHAISLVGAVMDRLRASKPPVSDLEWAEEQRVGPTPEQSEPSFEDIICSQAGFKKETWSFLTDLEFALLHKAGRMTRFIELAKLFPLAHGNDLIKSLRKRPGNAKTAREKKMWKDVNDVATLIAQMMVTRCLVVPACTGGVRLVLFRCASALFSLLPAADVKSNLVKLVQLAVTAAHLYVLAKAVHQQKSEDMKPFVCELYVRALTSGMNELEKLKLKPDKEREARQAESTLASWFLELGSVFGSVRLLGECTLTAFSMHPSQEMYDRIRATPELPPVRIAEQLQEPKQETNAEFGSWASDSRSQTNFVKTSEHLKMKQTQQANVLSTAILSEGEALGLGADLCQDIAALLSGSRVKTLSWDLDRELLLSNCVSHMERTAGGTKALTTELRYLNLDPNDYQHLKEEEDDDENDVYYGIEKGYEHLVELPEPQPETVWEDTLIFDDSKTESAYSTEDEDSAPKPRKKKTKKPSYSSAGDEDPLSSIAEAKKAEKKKERPHSKERSKEDGERSKERKKKPKKERSHSKDKESKKERKKKVKPERRSTGPLSQLIGIKVERPNDPLDSDCEGKSSIASLFCETNCTNVEYDGQYSMDELKSPDRKTPPKARKNSGASAANKNRTDKHDDKQPQTTINPEVKNQIAKLLQFRRNKSTTSTESSNSPAPSPVQLATHPKEEPQIKTEPMANWVGSKIVNPSDLPKGVLTHTQSLQLSSLNEEITNLMKTTSKGGDSRNNLVSKTINKVSYGFTDLKIACARTVPVKSYSRNRMCSIPELQLRYLEKLPPGTEEKQEQKSQKPSQNVTPGYSRTPQVKQHPSSHANKPQNLSQGHKTSSSSNEHKTETPRQSVIQRSPVKQSQSHQSSFEDFLKGIKGAKDSVFSTDATERRINKVIKPATRVSPVLPNILKPSKATAVAADAPKAEPTTSQSAKPVVQQKKPENAPNTFSRLSYMHKSKQNDAKSKPDAEQDHTALQKSISDELDQRMAEIRQNEMNSANPQRSVAITKVTNTYATCTRPKESPPKLDIIKLKPHEYSALAEANPVLKDMLKINEVNSSYRRIDTNAESPKPPSGKKSALSEKDQQDLINMLKQQNKLNEPVRQSKQYSNATLTNLLNSNPAISVFNNNSQIKAPNQQSKSSSPILNHQVKIPKQNQNLPQTDIKDLKGQLISKATILKTAELIHNRIMSSREKQARTVGPSTSKSNDAFMKSVENVMKTKDMPTEVNLKTKHATTARNEIVKTVTTPATAATTVMDAIRKQKTPSRGPNALEMVLNSDGYEQYNSTQSLRNLRIVKQKPEQTNQPTAVKQEMTRTVHSSTPVQTKVNTQTPTETAQPKIHINVELTNNQPVIKIQEIPEVTDPISQTLNSKTSRENDPFIFGIQNSEYDLIGELMDDDLRQELGELSSDEERSYPAPGITENNKNVIKPGSSVLNKSSTVTTERKLNTNRTPKPKDVCKTTNPVTQKFVLNPNKTVDVKSKDSEPKLQILSNEKVNLITRPNLIQHFSKDMAPQISQEKTTSKDTSQVKPAIIDTTNLIITAPPPPSSNMVIIRPDMPYEQYPTLHITEAPANSNVQNSYVAASNIPTMNTIQLTTFSPVMAPVLMQNTIGLSTLLPTASTPVVAVQNIPQSGPANIPCGQPTVKTTGNTHITNTTIKMAPQTKVSGADNVSTSKLSSERTVIPAANTPYTFANKASLLKPANRPVSKTSYANLYEMKSLKRPDSPIELKQDIHVSIRSIRKTNATKNKSGALKPKLKRTIVTNNEPVSFIPIIKRYDTKSYPGSQSAKPLDAQSRPEENLTSKVTASKPIKLVRKVKVVNQIPSSVTPKINNPAQPQEKHIKEDEMKSTVETENVTSNIDYLTKAVAPNLTPDFNVDDKQKTCPKKDEIKSKAEAPLLQNAVPLLTTQSQSAPNLEHKSNIVLPNQTDQIHLPPIHQTPEIKSNVEINKSCERKVLSEVQEKLTIPSPEKVEGKVTRNQRLSTENDKTIEDLKEKDRYNERERLKKKRLAIINRETSYRCFDFVIVLPYAPIKDESENEVLEKQTDSSDQKIGSDNKPESTLETHTSSPASIPQLSELIALNTSTPESPGNIENTVQNISNKDKGIATSGKGKKLQVKKFKTKKGKTTDTVTTKCTKTDHKKQGQDIKNNETNCTDVTQTRVSNRIRERKIKKSVSETSETDAKIDDQESSSQSVDPSPLTSEAETQTIREISSLQGLSKVNDKVTASNVQESSAQSVDPLPLTSEAETQTIREISSLQRLLSKVNDKVAASIPCEVSSKVNVKSSETDLKVDTTKPTDISTQLQNETIHILSSPEDTPDELPYPDVKMGAHASKELLDVQETSDQIANKSDETSPVQTPVISTDPNITKLCDLKPDKEPEKDKSDLEILPNTSAEDKIQKVSEKEHIRVICRENGETVVDTISIPAVPIVEQIIAEKNSEREKDGESLNTDVIPIDSDSDVNIAEKNAERKKSNKSLNTDVIPIDSDSDVNIAEKNAERKKSNKSLNTDVIPIDSDSDVNIAEKNAKRKKSNKSLNTDVIPIDSDSDVNEDSNTEANKHIDDVHMSDIPQSYKNGITFQELPPDPNHPSLKSIRVKLPNGRHFKATVHDSMNIDFDTLLHDPNLRKVFHSGLKEKKRVLLNYQQISTPSNKIVDTRIKLIPSGEHKTVLNPDVVNLISDDEDDGETASKESKLKFTTEFGSYAVKSLNKEHFDNHQTKFLQKCTVKLINCDPKNSQPDIDTKPAKSDILNNLRNAILNSDIEENNQIISLDDNINTIKTVLNTTAPEIIELDDSSDEDTISKIHPGEKIDALKNLLLKELGVADVLAESTESNKDAESNQKSSSLSNQSKLKSKYKAYVEPTKKDYSNIIPYECFVKLKKCDDLVRKMEDEIRISDISTEVIDVDEDFEPKLPRSGSFSILNDLVDLDDTAVEMTESDFDRSSPAIDIVETITAFHGTEADSNIEPSIGQLLDYDSYETTPCYSDWFDTKKNIRSRLMSDLVSESEDNEDTFIDSKTDVSTDYESDTDITLCSSTISDRHNTSVKEIGAVASLKKIMTDYYARDFALDLSKTESKNVPLLTCKRKLVVENNEVANKILKIDDNISENLEGNIDASKSSHQAESCTALKLETNIEETLSNSVPMSEVNHGENVQDSKDGRCVNHLYDINLKKIVCKYIVNNFVSVILHTKYSNQTELNNKVTGSQDKEHQDDENISAVDLKRDVVKQNMENVIKMEDSVLADINDRKPVNPDNEEVNSSVVEFDEDKSDEEVIENADIAKEIKQELVLESTAIPSPINATEEPSREKTTSPHLLTNESDEPLAPPISDTRNGPKVEENCSVLSSLADLLATTTATMNKTTTLRLDDNSAQEDNSITSSEVLLDSTSETESLKIAGIPVVPLEPTTEVLNETVEGVPTKMASPKLPTETPHENINVSDSENNDLIPEHYLDIAYATTNYIADSNDIADKDVSNQNASADIDKETIVSPVTKSTTESLENVEQDRSAEITSSGITLESAQEIYDMEYVTCSENSTVSSVIKSSTESSDNLEQNRSVEITSSGITLESVQEISDMEYVTCSENSDIDKEVTVSSVIKSTSESSENVEQERSAAVTSPVIPLKSLREICDVENVTFSENSDIDKETIVTSETKFTTKSSENLEQDKTAEITSPVIPLKSLRKICDMENVTCYENSDIDKETIVASEIKSTPESSRNEKQDRPPGIPTESAQAICDMENVTCDESSEHNCDTPVKTNAINDSDLTSQDEGADKENETIITENKPLHEPLENVEDKALEVTFDDKLDVQLTEPEIITKLSQNNYRHTQEDKGKLHVKSEVTPANSREITESSEVDSENANKDIMFTAQKEDTISNVCVDGNDNLTSLEVEGDNEIDKTPEFRNLEYTSCLCLEESKINTDAGAHDREENQNNIDIDVTRSSDDGQNKIDNDHDNNTTMTTTSATVLNQVNEQVLPEIDNVDTVSDDVAIIVEGEPLIINEAKYYCETEIVEVESVDSPLHSSIVGSPAYEEAPIDEIPGNSLQDKVAMMYREDDGVLLKGVEYEDPDRGTYYVFALEKSSDSSANNSNSTIESVDQETQIEESGGERLSGEKKEETDTIDSNENMEVMVPTKTYTKRNLKRKLFMGDISLSVKKRRLIKLKRNIDTRKLSNAQVNDSLYIKEFTRLLEYCSTIDFSYSISFHKDQVDVENILNDWPIRGDILKESQAHEENDEFDKLFEDLDEKPPYDPLTQSLSEELDTEYVLEEPCKTDDSNFNMGFGEGSGRVIQNFKRGGVTKFSAATLSDVKHSQPFLLSEDYYDCENENAYISKEKDQIEKIKRSIAHIQLRDKVRSFFKKTALELTHDIVKEKGKTSNSETFPFDLYIPKCFEPAPVDVVVQVVQVGQLPVSAAAQNPVTCDPRVTQVSDASPSQCSEENSPRDDSQQGIKTEYTELTTADLSMPMENYQHHIQTTPVESQEAKSMSMTENIPIETELIKSEVKIELVEETSEDTKIDETMDDSCELPNSDNHVNNLDYTYHANSTNVSMEQDSNIQMMQPMPDVYTQQKQNGATEKTDQIAHAMSAAGISTTAEPVHNTRAQALVNIISQKIRHSNGNAAQNSINTYSKSSPITAMALQQALAQILPPPLNQTNAPESNQQGQNPTVTPQVLHIVQGKNASGNQITLVDNSQQSVINQNTTPVLHIVQNKAPNPAPNSSGNPPQQQNTFSGLSLVDTGLQQGGNQLLHIVNTGNQKNANAGQLLKRVNLLTNLTNVPGSNDQKMVQFVCKSADGKSIQLNAPHQRSMVLRLQPIESPNIQTTQPKPMENQDMTPSPNTPNSGQNKETAASQQEIKSRSVYEENYAKFIQSSSVGKPVGGSTSLPKFNQAFGKSSFQDGNQKQPEISANTTHLPPVNTNNENTECPPAENNSINLEHISQMSSPPLLLRKSPQTSQPQPNLVQQIKQTIAPMNIQTMHGGVIYTRQIPVNIGGGQTINLITVPSTELIDDKQQSEVKFVNQSGEIEPSIIKIVPQSQPAPNAEVTQDESNSHANMSNENAQNPQPQPVLTQMRIKLPMLSKTPQMVSGARMVRPSFFQIQRNVIGGANQQVYQQLVLTAAPPLGQQTIRLPQAQAVRPKAPSETQSSPESQMSSSTLEQLREFDMVLEQVKERSTVQPNSTGFKLNTTSSDTTDSNVSGSSTPVETSQPVLYSIGGSQQLNVAYVNRKAAVATPSTSTFVRSPDSTGVADSPSSSNQAQSSQSVSNEPSSSGTSSQSRPRVGSKSKSRPKSSHSQVKINSVPPKPATQKPLEDEQTTQRILYILAEYKEQVENSPDKDKPAPRRRSNPPSNPGSSKRKKSSSGSRRPGARDVSPVQGDDTCRTMGSEDSSCGTSQGDCTESCMETHSPQDSPRKVARKLTFEQENAINQNQPRPQPQRNVIVADGQTITVARGAGGKPATAVLMPANYILPVSMVKGGQQIAIVTNRGPKLLTVGGGEGGATNALLLQRLIGPAGLKPVLARPGVRHVRLPTAALHNLQTFNLTTAATVQPPDSTNTASPAPAPTPPELIETRAEASPWTERESEPVRQERAATPEGSEPWNMPTSSDAQEYSYEETVRAENMDRAVLDPIPDRYSPDMEAQRIFDKMFDVESKKCFIVDSQDEPHCGYGVEASEEDKGYQVVQKKEGPLQRAHRVTHISAAALRHKYAILEHELRLQKSLSEECEDLGVDSPSASELFPEAELLFAASPAQDPPEAPHHNHHTPQPPLLNQTAIQADIDDQIATDQLLPREENPPDRRQLDVNLGLEDVGIVTVSEDGMQATIALDQEEFARSHPNTTFHSEPSEVHQPFTITGIKGARQISTIFHANRVPATVLMTAPQATTVISQTAHPSQGSIKYSDIDHMIGTLPGSHTNNVNLNSVLVKDDGLTRFDSILTDSRELHLSNTASAIVHPTGNATQVIRRVCYDDTKRERDARFLMDEPDTLIAGDDAKMIAEDSSRDATMESMAEDVDDDNSSPERHTELFWESNSASERSESRRPLDYSSDSEKCCKSPSFDETNSTDSSGLGSHMRHDSVIKEARLERSGSAEGSSADDTHPPLRTYPPKRMYHNPETETERSLSGKTRAGERSPDLVEGRRRTSVRGVVKRGCHCCNGSPTPAPPRPKKPRQRKPTLDFNTNN